MPKLFISYRRDDSADICGRIYDRLVSIFGREQLYRDIDSIPFGVDFRKHLQDAVGSCDVLLVLIGPNWIDIRDDSGGRRLDDEADFVRVEIETALHRDIKVIPLLVGGASIPKSSEFPAEIRDLAFRNAPDIRRDPDFAHDMNRLVDALQEIFAAQAVSAKKTAHSPVGPLPSLEDWGINVVSEPRTNSPRGRSMKLLEGQTVGIDLGTTYSCFSQINSDGQLVALLNSDGRTLTPSVVLLEDNGHVLVGPSFERISVSDPVNIVEAVKRQMGNKNYFKVYEDKKLTPEVISAVILKKLKQNAEQQIGPIANAVITVPYYFNDIRRKATQDAGEIAGLNVIDIVNEPTAATLAYAWIKGELGRLDLRNTERTILVYDLGGGTFDVTVVRYTPTYFRVLATDGDVMLGGLDWTHRIVNHVSEQFKHKFGMDPREDPETALQMSQECEGAKLGLSSKTQVPVNVYYKGKTLTVTLTRGDFERMTADLLQRTRDTTELVLQQADIQPGSLDEVILVGGSTYMPYIKRTLKEITGREPFRGLAPEEAVAQGAAIHAAILEARITGDKGAMSKATAERLRNISTCDVNSHSLGLRITAPNDPTTKINHIMIPRNTPIPFSTLQRFGTTKPNQQRIRVRVLEGDCREIDACALLGEVAIYDLPPNLPEGSPVEIAYCYNANGRVTVRAKCLSSNREASTEIDRGGGALDSHAVDRFRDWLVNYKVE